MLFLVVGYIHLGSTGSLKFPGRIGGRRGAGHILGWGEREGRGPLVGFCVITRPNIECQGGVRGQCGRGLRIDQMPILLMDGALIIGGAELVGGALLQALFAHF